MGAPWRQLPAAYGKGNSVGSLVRPGRLAASDGLPAGRSGSVRRAAGQHSRERSRRAPKQRGRARPRPQPGRLSTPRVAGATGHQGRHSGPEEAHEPPPHDPERYKARKSVERGLGWLKWWRRVATRYDKYAHRFLGFLYLAGAWIWLKSYLNTA